MSTRVVQIHDAAIDEYMSTMLLTTMEDVHLDGIVIVNADCIYGPAMQTAWKIQNYIDQTDIPLTLSQARGLNPFPWPYRGDCVKQGDVPALVDAPPHPEWPPYPDGDEWLLSYMEQLEGCVTLLVLCPMTPVAMLLQKRPDLAEKIEHLIWMGGAVNVAGNLDPTTLPTSSANPYAEWNVFWDPPAAAWVLENTSFPITLFPLDITDQVPIAPEFMQQLIMQGKQYRYSDLAAQSYSLVATEPFYDMWDVVTTCYLTMPQLFKSPKSMRLRVVTSGDKEGALVPDKQGREVTVALKLAESKAKKGKLPPFYRYVLKQFKR